MDSIQINRSMKGVDIFKGIYPRNQLPQNIKQRPAAFIVNTDSASEKGEHWVAIILFKENKGEYFDPFGLPPLHSDFIKFLNQNCLIWTYNSLGIQHHNSKACGKFCISYIKERYRGVSFCEFISQFSVNLAKNEEIINTKWKLS